MKYLFLGLCLFLSACDDDKVCPAVVKTIAAVGGCNGSGYCRVMYTDGTFDIQSFPIPLQQVQPHCK